jgi:predicted Zn-dependent protease
MWRGGKPGPVILTCTELTYEKLDNFRNAMADRLAERAQNALLRRDLDGSEHLLREALELEPENPVLWHNLAVTIRSAGRREEAEKLFEENHRRTPDYSFGLMQQADQLLEQGDVDAARQLVAGLLVRPRLHVREFSALCHLQMAIHDACGEPEASRAWFDRWVEVDPQHPALPTDRSHRPGRMSRPRRSGLQA